jgi:hypothetical protein
MTRTMVAIIAALFVFGGCAEPIQPTQAMTDEHRCVNAGGIWRANSFCEQPSGPGRK